MPRKVHFISGLPRSGSTLLAAILRQNPAFRAEMTGPVARLCGVVHETIAGAGEFAVLFDDERCAEMLRGVFDTYYQHVPAGSVVFDTNRTWTGKAALLGRLYPDCRIICCVRDIGWILDSLERLRLRNPLKLSRLYTQPAVGCIYGRVDALMNSEHGLIGSAWSTLREAWFSDAASRLIVIPYDALVRAPERTLRKLYTELGEPFFPHDFQNVVYEASDYDDNLRTPGLHTVRTRVECQERQAVIPPDVFAKYSKSHFWATPELNPRQVMVL